jgi:hypothetical protein
MNSHAFCEAMVLGVRAISCWRFQWRPGMRLYKAGGWCAEHGDILDKGYFVRVPEVLPNAGYPDAWPDLSDAATRGSLLDLVREAWGDSCAWLEATNRYYAFEDNGSTCCEPAWLLHVLDQGAKTYRKIAGMTEAEALLCALEMAP